MTGPVHRVFTAPALLGILYRYAGATGISPAPLFAAAGLDIAALRGADAETRVPITSYNALWQAIAERAGDPEFGLHLGEAAHGFLGGDVLTTIISNCANVGDALEAFARYHDLATNAVRLRVTRGEAETRLTWHVTTPGVVLDRHHWEAVVTGVALKLRDLAEQPIPCVEVHFSHTQPASTAEHRRIFRCPVRFDHPVPALVIPTPALSRPVFLASPALLAQLRRFADAQLEKLHPTDTWTDRVARSMREMLWRGEAPALDAVARAWAVSSRYVQKQLKAEGTTYRALRDSVRKEMALAYLGKPEVTLTDIAFLLGFSEQSAFTHAFKRSTGMSPQQYREKNPT